MSDAKQLFKESSQTYYYSSKFFSSQTREAITTLYAFVREADDYVDCTPQDQDGFTSFRDDYESDNPAYPVVDDFQSLEARYGFNADWTEAFLDSMEDDLTKATYDDIDVVKSYMYGSAEVIGLMITRILGVSGEDRAAKRLGRGMQYINFIRDVAEDHELGRTYIPQTRLDEHGLDDLTETTARQHPEAFKALIRSEVSRGMTWIDEGRSGFHAIPWRERTAIATATDMYTWTAHRITRSPFIIYDDTELKPSTTRVLTRGLFNLLL